MLERRHIQSMINKFKTIPIRNSTAVAPTQDQNTFKTIDFSFKEVVLENDDALIDFSKQNPYFELKKRPSTSAAPATLKVKPLSSISLLSHCNIQWHVRRTTRNPLMKQLCEQGSIKKQAFAKSTDGLKINQIQLVSQLNVTSPCQTHGKSQ